MDPLSIGLTVSAAANAAKDIKSALDKDDISNAIKLLGKAKSISEAASKYVMDYPVAVSGNLENIRDARSIAKQIELDCARFIILTSNLNPVLTQGRNVGDQLNAIVSGESYNFKLDNGFSVEIKKATEDDIANGYEYCNSSNSFESYQGFKKTSSFIKSTEMDDNDDGISSATDQDIKEAVKETAPDPTDDTNNTTTNATVGGTQKDPAIEYKFGIYERSLNELNKLGPTIVRLNLIIPEAHGNNNSIEVPIAVKASLQTLHPDDVKYIIKGADNATNVLHRFIKLTTGQIRFIRDFILGMDMASKDVEREKSMKQYPFYRNLITARRKNKLKDLFNIVGKLDGKNAVKKTQKELPMCTIIVTDDDMYENTGIKLTQHVRNPKYIRSLIDTYMLLGFGVVDQVNNMLYLYYAGEENPTVSDMKKLGGNTGTQSDSALLINALTKTMMRR